MVATNAASRYVNAYLYPILRNALYFLLFSSLTQYCFFAYLHILLSKITDVFLFYSSVEIPVVDCVINLNVPASSFDYVQRISRTISAGNEYLSWSIMITVIKNLWDLHVHK